MKEKFKKGTEEYSTLIGVRIFRILWISFLIICFVVFGVYLIDFNAKIAILSVHLAAYFIGTVIAMNCVTKYSTDNRYDFFEKVPIKSVFFRAKIYMIFAPVIGLLDFMLIVVLLSG
ncbi:MAG: hypothetical protein ACI396_00895 [Acutalibacteraceae bacterium]